MITALGDELILDRLDKYEEYLFDQSNALEAKASYLLATVAILAGLPVLLAERLPHNHRIRFALIFTVVSACVAALTIIWSLAVRVYKVELADGLAAWRDGYVLDLEANGYNEASIAAGINKELIGSAVRRVKHNRRNNAAKGWRLSVAYWATASALVGNIALLAATIIRF